jgi:hypothetical protein
VSALASVCAAASWGAPASAYLLVLEPSQPVSAISPDNPNNPNNH